MVVAPGRRGTSRAQNGLSVLGLRGRPTPDASYLDIDYPGLAASHYLSLIVGEVLRRDLEAAGGAVDGLIRAGVRAFQTR